MAVILSTAPNYLIPLPLQAAVASIASLSSTIPPSTTTSSPPMQVKRHRGGSAGPGWIRTSNTFKSGGSNQACRFYGSAFGPNSHFYTADAGECDYLKSIYNSAEKSWLFESYDFLTTLPTNGSCHSGTKPIYRAYNNGNIRGVDSNHRFSSSVAAIWQVLERGWGYEGVAMCAPN